MTRVCDASEPNALICLSLLDSFLSAFLAFLARTRLLLWGLAETSPQPSFASLSCCEQNTCDLDASLLSHLSSYAASIPPQTIHPWHAHSWSTLLVSIHTSAVQPHASAIRLQSHWLQPLCSLGSTLFSRVIASLKLLLLTKGRKDADGDKVSHDETSCECWKCAVLIVRVGCVYEVFWRTAIVLLFFTDVSASSRASKSV